MLSLSKQIGKYGHNVKQYIKFLKIFNRCALLVFSLFRWYIRIDVNYILSAGGFEDPALYTSWLLPEAAFNLWKSPMPFKYEKSATLVSNSQALLRPLDNMVGKAWNMFASR